jgi:hypothetical protein
MWWLLLLLIPLAIARAKAVQSAAVSAPTATPTSEMIRSDIPIDTGARETTVPPQNASTVTDASENLAVAFHAYSTILRNKLPMVSVPAGTPGTIPGGNYFGSGGSGGGRGSIGCPLEGTEIKCLGVLRYDLEKFDSGDWITIKAGEFELTATPSHLLYTDKGVVKLSDLDNGALVVTEKGERRVDSKFSFSTKQTALRIHVPESHLYFASGILSHNKA